MGSYGYGNLGDELMLEGVLAGLRRTLPYARITVLSGDSEQTSRLHNVRSIEWGGGTLARLRRYWEYVQSDLLVVGGGNLRDNLTRDNSSRFNVLAIWLDQVLMAHEIGVPTMCYAVSIGHVTTPEGGLALKNCLEKVDAISVREPESAAKVLEFGVSREVVVAADAAFSAIPQPRHSKTRKGVALFLRHWYERGNYTENSEVFDSMIGEIAAYCDAFVERYHEPIWMVPFKATGSDADNDTYIHQELYGRMQQRKDVKVLDRVPDMETLMSIFASARFVIGMRLHSLIIATALGTPWVSVNYDPKVRAFARYAGQDRFSLDVSEVTSHRLSELEKVLITNEGDISTTLGSVSEGFRTMERRNAEIARDILVRTPTVICPEKTVVRSARLWRYRFSRRQKKG